LVRLLVLYDKPSNEREFDRHYREVHIPLAKKLPGLRRYTISRNGQGIRGEAHYLVAELDWDDMDALQKAFQSAEGQAAGQDVTDHLSRLSPGIRSMAYPVEEV
jgi:uncharacterized protein (TIGR02118 family)